MDDISKKEIKEIIKEEKPETVYELIDISTKKFQKSEAEISRIILDMFDSEEISLKNPQDITTFNEYIFSIESSWFWLIAVTILLYVISTRISSASNLMVFRYIFGGAFTLFIPGFTLVKALFLPSQLGNVEMVALSIVSSLAISPIISFMLNFTSWGITLIPITVGISGFSLITGVIGLFREYSYKIQ